GAAALRTLARGARPAFLLCCSSCCARLPWPRRAAAPWKGSRRPPASRSSRPSPARPLPSGRPRLAPAPLASAPSPTRPGGPRPLGRRPGPRRRRRSPRRVGGPGAVPSWKWRAWPPLCARTPATVRAGLA
ncbi:unnamed protein product, partial [Prorocentrum cordatum]